MSFSVRWRLSLMMLLEYLIWGAWAPVLSGYLSAAKDKGGLGFSNTETGFIYSLLPLASIIAPFFAGQLADRLFATERLMGVLQLLGGAALMVMASQHGVSGMALWMFIFSLLFAPTLVLTNSLAFSHMRDSEKEFGLIRVFGTIGWILAGWLLTVFRTKFPTLTPSGMSDSLLVAGVAAIVLGLLSFGLPHTPPKKEGVNPLAFLDALKLMRNRDFLVFIIISFVVATELQFYYILTAPFLEKRIGIPQASVPGWMTLAQLAEIVVMAVLLPLLLPKMGVRKAMVVGIIAWPLRYIVFALGAAMPEEFRWLVVASLTLHGFCYVFFFTVGFIYVDLVAPKDIRASAQSLIGLVVLGVGAYVGSLFTGKIADMFTSTVNGVQTTNWVGVFLVPCALTVLCALLFPLLFRATEAASADAGPTVTAAS